MSKKVIRAVGTVATIVAGIALIGTGIGALAGGTMMLTGIASASAIASIAGAVAAGASLAGSLLTKKPSISSNATSRLFASLDPNAPRKIVFGETAMATDVVYQTYTGTNQEYYHQVLAVASHQCASIDQIWFDNELAWSGGTVQGRYVGYLTVATKLVGTTGGGFVIDAGWGANHSLTGCPQIWLKFKLTGNSKTAESPFSSQVPTRMTIRGKGALVYDPRLDTTVTGGSGSQRPGTQTGWAFGTTAGRNPALQLLWYLLGWKIGTKFAVGRGIPPERIDLASFLVAANICDESVALAAGGTEPRYRADGVFSENDDPSLVIGNLEAAMNGRLRDSGGKISLIIFKNDLASPAQTFTEADIIGEDLWRQTPSVEETFNTVRGRYVDASDNGLYQLAEYPEASLASNDGIERIDSFDLPVVQSPSQAQRLAKTRLQRRQYGGVFTANFNAKGWTVTVGDIATLSHAALGWSNKLFRVTRHGLSTNGIVPMELREENSAIYAWSASEAAAVEAAASTVYDPTLSPLIKALAESITATLTNEAHVVPADSTGAVTSYAGASSSFRLMNGAVDVSTLFTLSTQSNPQGLTVSYNNTANPRSFTISGGLDAGEDLATITVRATGSAEYAAITIDKIFTLGKAKTGATGSPGTTGAAGSNSAIVYIFKRSPSAPALPSATTTYTFASGVLSGLNNGWTQAVPSGTDPLYVSTASAVSSSATDTISSSEWASSVIMAQNGTAGSPGSNGSDGLNAATVYLFQRNNTGTAPAVPSVSTTYTFATAALSGINNGWSQTVPADAGGKFLYVTTATALSTGATDTIATGEWAVVRTMAKDGLNGNNGIDGIDGEDGKWIEFVWKRAVSQPATPSGNGIPTGWDDEPPTGTDPLWMSKSKQELDGTIIISWSVPIRHDGPPGDDGLDAITLSASPPAITVPTTAGGTPTDSIPGFSLTVYKGGTSITATSTGTTYSVSASSGVSGVSHVGNGVFTVSGMTADTGYVQVTVSNVSTAIIRITYTKVKQGGAANAALPTHITSLNDSSTYAVVGTLEDIAVGNGQTLTADANASWYRSAAYQSQGKLTYQNITDGGAEVDFSGSEVVGNVGNLAVGGEPASPSDLSTTGTWTNALGATKVVRVRFYFRRTSGAGVSSGVDGYLGGHT